MADCEAGKITVGKKRLSRTMSSELEKDRGEDRLKSTKASGTLFTYIGDLIMISIVGMLLAMPPLMIPIADPALGFMANLPYWLFYNPCVGCIYITSSYIRLSHLCYRGEASANATGKPKFDNYFGCNVRTVVCILLGCICHNMIMGFVGFLWDDGIAHSYILLYLAPVMCTITDVNFVWLLPAEERVGGVLMFLANYSAMVGVPLFVIFFPILVKVWLPPLCASLIPVFIFPALGNFLHGAIQPAITKELEKVGFECSWMDSGIPIHLEAMICIAEMMLFPGAETIIVLVAIVAAELVQRMLDLRALHKAMMDEDELGSYASLRQTDSSLPTGAPPPQVGSRRRRLSLVMTSDEHKNQARERALALGPEAYAETYMKGVVQLTTLCCPLLFCILTYIITKRGNKAYYYVYECLSEDQELVAVQFAAIALGFQVCYFTMDISFLYYHHTADAFLLMFQTFLQHNRLLICTTLSFSCAIFTSCFMIKEDGILILQDLIKHCHKEPLPGDLGGYGSHSSHGGD